MASGFGLPSYDPNIELPFALRLAQFLLQGGNQLGQHREHLLAEKTQSDRDFTAQGELLRRTQEMSILDEDRDALRLQRGQAQADRATAAADKANLERNRRSAISKFIGVPPTREVVSEDISPVDKLPQDASDAERPPTLFQHLVKSTQKKDFSDAMREANLSPDEMTSIDDKVMGHLKAMFPGEKTEEPYTLGEGQVRFRGNRPIASVKKAAKEPKPFFEGKTETELSLLHNDPNTPQHIKDQIAAAFSDMTGRDIKKFQAQGKATGEAMVARKGQEFDTAPLGDEAGRWVGPGGRPISPGLSRKEAVAAGGRPLGSGDEAKSLRAAAGLGRYLRQYLPIIDLYPEAGSLDAANLVNSGVSGAKIYMSRKSGGAATRIEALEGQITKLIRAWGDTANAAVQERTTTLKGVPGYMETKQSAREKLSIILDQAIGSFEDLGVEPPPDLLELQAQMHVGGSVGPSPAAQNVLKKYGYGN